MFTTKQIRIITALGKLLDGQEPPITFNQLLSKSGMSKFELYGELEDLKKYGVIKVKEYFKGYKDNTDPLIWPTSYFPDLPIDLEIKGIKAALSDGTISNIELLGAKDYTEEGIECLTEAMAEQYKTDKANYDELAEDRKSWVEAQIEEEKRNLENINRVLNEQ